MTRRFDSDLGPFGLVTLRLVLAPVSDRAVRVFALLAASYADRDGKAFPSRGRIAQDLAVSTDTVDRAIAELTAAGFLGVSKRHTDKGDQTSNLYILRYAGGEVEAVAVEEEQGGRKSAAGGAAPVRLPGRKSAAGGSRTDAAPRTSTLQDPDPANQTTHTQTDARPLSRCHQRFAEFRAVWPAGYWTGHEAALRQWEQIDPDDDLHARILQSVRDHVAHHPRWRPDDKGEAFIPNPRTFLSQRRWLDDVRRPSRAAVAAERRALPEEPQAVPRVPAPAADPAKVDAVLADPALRAEVAREVDAQMAPWRQRLSATDYSNAMARGLRTVAERYIYRLKAEEKGGGDDD